MWIGRTERGQAHHRGPGYLCLGVPKLKRFITNTSETSNPFDVAPGPKTWLSSVWVRPRSPSLPMPRMDFHCSAPAVHHGNRQEKSLLEEQ